MTSHSHGVFRALRQDLLAANFTRSAVATCLSPEAHRQALDGSFALLTRELAHLENRALATLIELFVAGNEVPLSDAESVFRHSTVAALASLDILGQDLARGTVHARVSLSIEAGLAAATANNPAGELYILSDLDDHLRQRHARRHAQRRGDSGHSGTVRDDHVMGVGGATRTLFRTVPKSSLRGQSVLDLGCGNGVLALAAASFGAAVTGTDISARALSFARANTVLNGLEDADITWLEGDLFEPVADQRFDLVISNPPFVITPQRSEPVQYRSAPLRGDALMQQIVTAVPEVLAPGGSAYLLGNWEVHTTQPKELFAAIEGWIGPELSAWVIARDVVSPAEYAKLWSRDGGALPGTAEYDKLIGTWLDDFAAREVTAVVLGWIQLHHPVAGTESVRRFEHVTGPAETAAERFTETLQRAWRIGSEVASLDDAALLGTRLTLAPEVSETREYRPGNEHPSKMWLTVSAPLFRSTPVDTATAGIVGACDGELTLGDLCAGFASLYDADAHEVAAQLLPIIRDLAWQGVFAAAD